MNALHGVTFLPDGPGACEPAVSLPFQLLFWSAAFANAQLARLLEGLAFLRAVGQLARRFERFVGRERPNFLNRLRTSWASCYPGSRKMSSLIGQSEAGSRQPAVDLRGGLQLAMRRSRSAP
jgi:hypothetical protein